MMCVGGLFERTVSERDSVFYPADRLSYVSCFIEEL